MAESFFHVASLNHSLDAFAGAEKTQSARHIKPLHHYVATRLVIEGGFLPEELTPTPPLKASRKSGRNVLELDEDAAKSSEQTVLGGLKTKDVDVVVAKRGIGPVIAVSVKGTLGATRNLTNRMEEAVGDCTNLHLFYPALVYGFLHVIRANREADCDSANDVVICADGTIADPIQRYHEVLTRLTNRDDLRDDPSRYEAIALSLVNPKKTKGDAASLNDVFPPESSKLSFDDFFSTLYRSYDLRFVYSAPKLASRTERLEWAPESPAFKDDVFALDYMPRVAEE